MTKLLNKRNDERGSTLLLTLVFMALFGTLVAALLAFGDVNLNLNDVQETNANNLYAADGAIEWATNATLTNAAECPAAIRAGKTLTAAEMSLPDDVSQVTVKCTQVRGPGSNTFAGYSVVTGTHQLQTGAASSQCQSLSINPSGSGVATFADFLDAENLCAVYPAGAGSPDWVRQGDTTFLQAADTTGPQPRAYDITVLDMHASDAFNWWTVGYGSDNRPRIYWGSETYDFQRATGNLLTVVPTAKYATEVWGADPDHVWVVTTEARPGDDKPFDRPETQKPALLFSADTTDQPTQNEVWTKIAIPNARTIDDLFGFDATGVWALGSNAANKPMVWRCTATACDSGTLLDLPSAVTTGRALAGVAVSATDLRVVGSHGTANDIGTGGIAWSTTNGGTTWSTPQVVAGAIRLVAVDALNGGRLWAVGAGGAAGVNAVVSAWGGTPGTWQPAYALPETAGSGAGETMNAIITVNAGAIWIAGSDDDKSAGNGLVRFCSNGNCTSAADWTTTGQKLPAGTTPLYATTGLRFQAEYALNVGGKTSWVLTYAPLVPGDCSPCLAQILGGPIFNANGYNIASGLDASGGFEQYIADGSCPTPPAILKTTFSCATTIPEDLRNWSEPLPDAVPAAAPAEYQGDGKTISPGTASCPSYQLFVPGKYTDMSFVDHKTHFFKPGVYYLDTGKMMFDNGKTPPNDLFLIGGKPAEGDVPELSDESPCWDEIQAGTGDPSNSWSTAVGTGVTFILGADTWWDIHTVNLEIFTRTGGPASEGAQGIAVRETCTARTPKSPPSGSLSGPTCPAGKGWAASVIGKPNQIFQADANNHNPRVKLHGRMFVPNHNVTEFTNDTSVVLGAVWANSLEFTYADDNSPPVTVSGGSPGEPTVVIEATSGTTTVQAFVPFRKVNGAWVIARGANAVADRPYSWRIKNVK